MSVTTVAAKYGPPIAVAAIPFDPWWMVLVPAGLLVGMLARAGRMVNDRRSSDEIRQDLFVSLLIGGANAVLAAVLIHAFGLDYLKGLAVSAVCGFGGVKTIEAAARWAHRHIIDDAGKARQAEQKNRAIAHLIEDRELDRLARDIDRKIDEVEP